jgi:hypothetical protein
MAKKGEDVMSTEIINLRLTEAWRSAGNEHRKIETSPQTDFIVSHLPFEVVYQALYSPSPTPEELRREYFLLECD